MSRVGKQLIAIPSGVTVSKTGDVVTVKGPRGSLEETIHPVVEIKIENNEVTANVANKENKKERALWGTFASLIANMVKGVTDGYEKKLEVNGVGYRAEIKGNDLVLNVGYSHQVNFPIPEGLEITVDKNVISISGIDKQQVGQVSAQIRAVRKPEPYKGKGIKYVDEIIRRKAGKAGKAAA